jgi:hypothetical protein
MYHDPDPIGSRMRERTQERICQDYLLDIVEKLPLEETHKRIRESELLP